VSLKEGDSHSPKEDNSERVKIQRLFLKKIFSRTSRLNQSNLVQIIFGEENSS
jgi:hypothetical protein